MRQESYVPDSLGAYENWDAKIQEKASQQLRKSLKYLRDLPLQLGFSLANLTDHCLAPCGCKVYPFFK